MRKNLPTLSLNSGQTYGFLKDQIFQLPPNPPNLQESIKLVTFLKCEIEVWS